MLAHHDARGVAVVTRREDREIGLHLGGERAEAIADADRGRAARGRDGQQRVGCKLRLGGSERAEFGPEIKVVVAGCGVGPDAYGDAGRRQRPDARRWVAEVAVRARARHYASSVSREQLDVAVAEMAAVHRGRAAESTDLREVGDRARPRRREAVGGSRGDG